LVGCAPPGGAPTAPTALSGRAAGSSPAGRLPRGTPPSSLYPGHASACVLRRGRTTARVPRIGCTGHAMLVAAGHARSRRRPPHGTRRPHGPRPRPTAGRQRLAFRTRTPLFSSSLSTSQKLERQRRAAVQADQPPTEASQESHLHTATGGVRRGVHLRDPISRLDCTLDRQGPRRGRRQAPSRWSRGC